MNGVNGKDVAGDNTTGRSPHRYFWFLLENHKKPKISQIYARKIFVPHIQIIVCLISRNFQIELKIN